MKANNMTSYPVCIHCASTDIDFDCRAKWCVESQAYVVTEMVYAYCAHCSRDTEVNWAPIETGD